MKEPRYSQEQQDVIFNEGFLDEFLVRKNGGNPNAGATDVLFSEGIGIFDGTTAYISYPSHKVHLCEPERAFSIRTKVYLTNTDASVFLQLYISGADASKTLRFMIGGNWPAVGMNDKFVLELWDNVGLSIGELTRGRMYDQVLTTLALNKWVEFACTYDGRGGATPEAGICLYMDGVRVDDADISYGGGVYSGMNYHSDLPLEIGKNVEGKMEFLKVYNRVLTPEEIQNAFEDKRFKPFTSPDCILDIDSQSGSILDRQNNSLTVTSVDIFKEGSLRSMLFDGTTSLIETTLANDIKSISFWVKPNTDDESIIDLGGGNTIETIASILTAAWADNIYINGTTGTTVTKGIWNLVTCTVVAAISVTDIDIGKIGVTYYKGYLNGVRINEGVLNANQCSQIWSSEKKLYNK